MFEKIIETKRKSAYVAEQILAAIRQGEYKEGDRLPPERAIAEQMNVSRNCVREALSVLQISHILESKVGAGTYVRNSAGAKVDIGQLLNLAKDSKDLLEIWEARKEIESSLISLAIDRISSDKLNKIHNILEKMREAAQIRDSGGYLDANKDFHLAIADAADNLPLKNALGALMEMTTQQLLEEVNLGYVLESIKKSFQEHEDIYNAIREQNKQLAVEVIRIHFEVLERYLRRKYLLQERNVQ